VHQVGFIYKIIQECTAKKHKKNSTRLFEVNGWRIWNDLEGTGCSLKSGTWKIFVWRECKCSCNVLLGYPMSWTRLRNDHPDGRQKLYGLKDFAVYFVAGVTR